MDTQTLIQKIGGIPAQPDLQHTFQREVADILGVRNERKFPGAQPVSFAGKHIQELKKADYYVCEKTDGIRFLMYLTDDGQGNACHYLIDRKNDYYYVKDLYFPHHERNDDFRRFHVRTILDGELVEDRMGNGQNIIKFFVFDLLVMGQQDLRTRSLDKRLGYVKEYILKPLNKYLNQNPQKKAEMAFRVEDKKTEFSYALPKMFHEIIPQVKQLHGNDGLIFTCRLTPYQTGTDQHILKWKPPEENTVDFLLSITWPVIDPDPSDPDQSPQEDFFAFPHAFALFIFHGGDEYSRVGDLYVTPADWDKMKALGKPLQNAIVECYLEDLNPPGSTNGHTDDNKRWRFHRLRDDKLEANHVSVYENVIGSIRDHITEDDLIRHADEIRSAWKSRQAGGK